MCWTDHQTIWVSIGTELRTSILRFLSHLWPRRRRTRSEVRDEGREMMSSPLHVGNHLSESLFHNAWYVRTMYSNKMMDRVCTLCDVCITTNEVPVIQNNNSSNKINSQNI